MFLRNLSKFSNQSNLIRLRLQARLFSNHNMEWKYKPFLPSHSKKLELIHFNDVYDIEEGDIGQDKPGSARFVTALD